MWKSGTWGSMRMKEKTLEDKRDLMLLNMRSTIDPNHHYKHSDVKAPQFFQVCVLCCASLNCGVNVLKVGKCGVKEGIIESPDGK